MDILGPVNGSSKSFDGRRVGNLTCRENILQIELANILQIELANFLQGELANILQRKLPKSWDWARAALCFHVLLLLWRWMFSPTQHSNTLWLIHLDMKCILEEAHLSRQRSLPPLPLPGPPSVDPIERYSPRNYGSIPIEKLHFGILLKFSPFSQYIIFFRQNIWHAIFDQFHFHRISGDESLENNDSLKIWMAIREKIFNYFDAQKVIQQISIFFKSQFHIGADCQKSY